MLNTSKSISQPLCFTFLLTNLNMFGRMQFKDISRISCGLELMNTIRKTRWGMLLLNGVAWRILLNCCLYLNLRSLPHEVCRGALKLGVYLTCQGISK